MIRDQPLNGLRALVVEDDYFTADDLKTVLTSNGASFVKLSGNIDDARRNVREHSFDFALVDLNLHGEMTYLLADEFQRINLLFAFVSGYDRQGIPQRFAAVPNWGKPYDAQEVVAGIHSLWAQPVTA